MERTGASGDGCTFSVKWACQVSGSGNLLKKAIQKKSCYSVEEAIELNVFRFARCTSSWSDRYDLLFNQGFNFWWRYSSLEELSAYMYGCGKVCLVNILSAFFLDDYV